MTRYSNNGGDSGVSEYEINDDGIIIQFNTGAKYLYTYTSAGTSNIEEMKKLALRGEGLNSYIMKYARTSYSSKLN
ncbi:MAG: hypothetical protein DRG78_02275 [Epsilonproteobacteria bacterium]|nr:MAG: hypothetical protein DRG78_02275 [Campylobacterota bacterium]